MLALNWRRQRNYELWVNNLQSIVAAGKESNRRNRKRRAQENRLAQYSLWFSFLFIPDFIQKDETHFFNFLEKTLQSQESIVLYRINNILDNEFYFPRICSIWCGKKITSHKINRTEFECWGDNLLFTKCMYTSSSAYFILCSSYLN